MAKEKRILKGKKLELVIDHDECIEFDKEFYREKITDSGLTKGEYLSKILRQHRERKK